MEPSGSAPDAAIGAASADRLFGVVEARRVADGVTVTTDDGSAGTQGWVSDVLPDLIARTGAGAERCRAQHVVAGGAQNRGVWIHDLVAYEL